MLTCEIVTIGDELNRGEIVDTNSSWLAERLTALGVHVRWRSSVNDDAEDMRAALAQAVGRADLVVSSGGLGPTEDDRTLEVIAALVGAEVMSEPAHEEKMRQRFAARGLRLTANNLRQVRVPKGAEVLPNSVGQAPGFGVRHGRAWLYALPGVPREQRPMFEAALAPRIVALGGAGDERPFLRCFRVAAMGESQIDDALTGLLDGVGGATLHFRIAFPENLVTVVLRCHDPKEAAEALDRIEAEVRRRLGDHLYGTGETSLAARVGERLVAAGATLAVAESCTGGLLGAQLTEVAGASRYFVGGVVAYADEVKRGLLGVRPETLAQHGAVSEPTVVEMADGVRRTTRATWGVALSGIAGPDGGSADKPVGTVFIAVTSVGRRVAERFLWSTERGLVRQLAAQRALHLLWKELAERA